MSTTLNGLTLTYVFALLGGLAAAASPQTERGFVKLPDTEASSALSTGPTHPQGAKNVPHHHYKLIDMGTFGGPESYILAPAIIASPNPMNRRGVTVGGAGTSIPTIATSDPVICGGSDGGIPFVNHALKWDGGVVTDLGSLGAPDDCSVATSINERGEIAGQSENGVVDPLFGANEIRAVVWKDGQITDLGTLGGAHSLATTINNKGEVVGLALNSIPDPFSLFDFGVGGSSVGTQTRAFLWQQGTMRDLGTLGGPDAWGEFLNDRGQVLGFSYINSTPVDNGPWCPPGNVPAQHPFLWADGRMTDLGSLGGTCAGSEIPGFQGALNNPGQVVGASTLPGNQIFHPFLWTKPGPMQDLGTLGGDCGNATAINDAGDVVGEADLPGAACGQLFHAFLWKKGKMMDLGTVDGDACSEVGGINSRGQIAGASHACDFSTQHAVLWEQDQIVDLNTLIPTNSALYLTNAIAINDRGEIAGFGNPFGCFDDVECGHAFLLIPCDDDHPDVEGCDYSLVHAAPAAPRAAQANQSHQVPKALLQKRGSRRLGIRRS
jgi:probable HAF family extracellular repeat protein